MNQKGNEKRIKEEMIEIFTCKSQNILIDKKNSFLVINSKMLEAMLEYTKTILVSVSFDKSLFQKELEKSLNTLDPKEIRQLHSWLGQKYSRMFPEIIEEYF